MRRSCSRRNRARAGERRRRRWRGPGPRWREPWGPRGMRRGRRPVSRRPSGRRGRIVLCWAYLRPTRPGARRAPAGRPRRRTLGLAEHVVVVGPTRRSRRSAGRGRAASSSTQCSTGPCSQPVTVAVGDRPAEVGDPHDVAGSRPAARAASSIAAWRAGTSSSGSRGRLGIQPSAARPTRRSIRGPYAPSQMPIACAGGGTAVRPLQPVVRAVGSGCRARPPTRGG